MTAEIVIVVLTAMAFAASFVIGELQIRRARKESDARFARIREGIDRLTSENAALRAMLAQSKPIGPHACADERCPAVGAHRCHNGDCPVCHP